MKRRCRCCADCLTRFQCSSASRKFLNRSRRTRGGRRRSRVSVLFSEPKIPQFDLVERNRLLIQGFSALQRAENSSITPTSFAATRDGEVSVLFSEPKIPQLSLVERRIVAQRVSVLFSEPKIPQFDLARTRCSAHLPVSVLFSEPKIPQSLILDRAAKQRRGFSALQRAENSSI